MSSTRALNELICQTVCKVWLWVMVSTRASKGVTFPSSLKTLTFGANFNQSLARVALPSTLQSLTFGREFNQSLERVTLPSSLKTLTFGANFNQSLKRVSLPSTLQSLALGDGFHFGESFEQMTLPSTLKSLSVSSRLISILWFLPRRPGEKRRPHFFTPTRACYVPPPWVSVWKR